MYIQNLELNIARDDWGQLKVGVSSQEYISCDNYITYLLTELSPS
jgi:hypothetical protein